MRKRKGSALLEVVLAVAIVVMPMLTLLTILTSSQPIVAYTTDKVILDGLAYTKISEVESHLKTDNEYYKSGYYYGFRDVPGSDYDLANAGQDDVPGTFYRLGHPEIRYQFFITFPHTNLAEICLRVWRVPDYKGGLILEEVVKQDVALLQK